jgi:malate synthase
MNATVTIETGIDVAPLDPVGPRVLTPDALMFVARLVRRFRDRREAVLRARRERQARLDRGARLRFLSDTAYVRSSKWKIAPVPPDLRDRRVEITGPVDRKTIINGLNSGARVFMADFEDATSPTWANCVHGQYNLIDAAERKIRYVDPRTGNPYRLAPQIATLMVRPRGWHLPEVHFLVDGQPAPAALVDFGLFFFHNARTLRARGTGPYFYLPKLESHLEARLWNDVFVYAQDALNLPRGTVKATVLIETLPAAFEMDEILYELRDHSAGLNCGRWDYIFSFIKTHRNDPAALLPDRAQVTMDKGFLRAYVRRLIHTCHRRGAHAIGGMAAQIPIKHDLDENEAALHKVWADKLREVRDGHDGTWVAHPGLVSVARDVFDRHMPAPNQIATAPGEATVTAEDLLEVPTGTRTEEGLRCNLRVGVQYIDAWLRGRGCVPLYHLMEDVATAEISRAQVWQWVRHAATLEDGRIVTKPLVQELLDQELANLDAGAGATRISGAARQLFLHVATSDELVEFLTLPAYDLLTSRPSVL